MNSLVFWNGNKSASRQSYERDLLQHVLDLTTEEFGPVHLSVDDSDYPLAEDEGSVFQRGTDVLVTVAGNAKFLEGSFIPVFVPLAKGLLGHRLLIIREESSELFATEVKDASLKSMRMGIPATWADADLFRHNGYSVVEKGTLAELFQRLKRGECDYASFGVNEVHAIFEQYANPLDGLVIEPNRKLFYPFALVFYVHPNNRRLANRIKEGLQLFQASGQFDTFFNRHYENCIEKSRLVSRRVTSLVNPVLPRQLSCAMTESLINR